MNKTININLGGFFFHIDETAYLKLKRYLEAVSKSLNDDPQGKNEIIADIEARISELLSEKIKDERQVVNDNDIEDIILIMGQPEDYADAEEDYSQSSYSYKRNNTSSKKLFRDGDDKFIAGVCSGLGYYLGIDTIWIRIAFILLASSGIGIVPYIVLWILLPEATTTAEKLQMEGEAVNIDNIEKKIREEFTNASEKIKDAANTVSEKVKDAANNVSKKTSQTFNNKKKTNNGLDEFLSVIGKILMTFFKVISKIVGVVLIFSSSIVILASIIGIFSVGGLEAMNLDEFLEYPPVFFNTSIPEWALAILILLLVVIPFVGLFVLGLRILSNNVKRLNKVVSLSLLGTWIIVALIISFSFFEANTAFRKGEIYTKKQLLDITQVDTLTLKMVNNDDIHFLPNFIRNTQKHSVQIDGTRKTYSNNVRIEVKKSKNNENYIIIKKRSFGKNKKNAKEKAKEIEYNYTIENNIILLDAFFLSDFKTIHKDEMIAVTIYLAENSNINFDDSTASYLYSVRNKQNFYHRELTKHFFTMGHRKLICSDCDEESNKSEL